MRASVVFLVACLVFLESGATPKRVPDGDLSVASLSRMAEGRKLLDTRENPNGNADELTSRQRRIFNNLTLEQLLVRAGVESSTMSPTQLEAVLRLVSETLSMEKPIEAANEGEENKFLFLTPELLIDEFGSEEGLNRTEFENAVPVVLSCLSHERCALITDVEYLDHDHDHDHDHEEDEDHSEHEDNDEHDHDHDHEEHEDNDEHDHDHDHEDEEHEDNDDHDHDHEEHEDNDEHDHDHDHEEHEDNDEHDHDHDEHGESDGHSSVTRRSEADHDDHSGHDHGGHDHHEDEDDDDDTETIKIVAAFVLFAEAILGAMIPIVLGKFNGFEAVLSLINCFAGGVILSTGLIHLVPHVIEYEGEVDSIGDYPLGMTVVSLSFALVFFVEHILLDVHSHEHATDTTQTSLVDKEKDKEKEAANMSFFEQLDSWKDPLVLLLATAVHSILEALVLGIENDSYTVWLLFASIAGHKGATALALSSRFWTKQPPIGYALAYSILFAITAPLGVWIGTSLENVPSKTNLILTGMSTGTFLYIGAYEVISDEFHKQDSNPFTRLSSVVTRYLKFLAVLAGILMIAGVAFIPHPDHDHGHCGH